MSRVFCCPEPSQPNSKVWLSARCIAPTPRLAYCSSHPTTFPDADRTATGSPVSRRLSPASSCHSNCTHSPAARPERCRVKLCRRRWLSGLADHLLAAIVLERTSARRSLMATASGRYVPPWLPRHRRSHPLACTALPDSLFGWPKWLYAISRIRGPVSTVCAYDSCRNNC
jgi:hypothetical protein